MSSEWKEEEATSEERRKRLRQDTTVEGVGWRSGFTRVRREAGERTSCALVMVTVSELSASKNWGHPVVGARGGVVENEGDFGKEADVAAGHLDVEGLSGMRGGERKRLIG